MSSEGRRSLRNFKTVFIEKERKNGILIHNAFFGGGLGALKLFRRKTEEEAVRQEIAVKEAAPFEGLTEAEAAARAAAGWDNRPVEPPTRTTGQIVRENLLTYFNLVFLVLALCLVAALIASAFTSASQVVVKTGTTFPRKYEKISPATSNITAIINKAFSSFFVFGLIDNITHI